MGKQDNMLERIKKKPTAKDISPEELQSFLKHYGFNLKRTKGDHFIYEYPTKEKVFILNIPMKKPVKPVYIDMLREIILEMEG